MRKRARIHFCNGLWLGRGHTAYPNTICRWCKSLNIHLHHLNIPSTAFLAPNQPFYQSCRNTLSPACRLRGISDWGTTKLFSFHCFSITIPFLLWQAGAIHSLNLQEEMETIKEHNTTASPKAYDTYGSVRTFIIYPGSQVCVYLQYKLMSSWKCCTKCYLELIIAEEMDEKGKRIRCRKKRTASSHFWFAFP